MSDMIEAEKAVSDGPKEEDKPKRTMEILNAEYSPLVAQIGERSYKIRELKSGAEQAMSKLGAEIEDLAKRIDDLGKEAAALKAKTEAEAVGAAPAPATEV